YHGFIYGPRVPMAGRSTSNTPQNEATGGAGWTLRSDRLPHVLSSSNRDTERPSRCRASLATHLLGLGVRLPSPEGGATWQKRFNRPSSNTSAPRRTRVCK